MHISYLNLDPLPKDHLARRALLRSLLETCGLPSARALAVASSEQIQGAAAVIEAGGDPASVVTEEEVAGALSARVEGLWEAIETTFFDDDFLKVAESFGLAPELGLVAIAQAALFYVLHAEDGLEVRCEDVRLGCDLLEDALRDAGEATGIDLSTTTAA